MNVYILTDIEGIPGITTMDDIIPRGTEAYERSCRYLEQTVNWVVETCAENGAENIYYRDGHGGGGNIKPENIDPRAIKIDIEEWNELMPAGKIDCVLYVGAHARAGTLGGFLDHTFKSKVIFEFCLNGEPASELSFIAALHGAFDVPVALCVGDTVACQQAKEYIPEIKTAIVKHATERNFCQDLPNAEQIIKEAVVDALKNYKSIPPYKVSLPVTIQQTTYRSDMTDESYAKIMAKGNPRNVERVDARTLRRVQPEITCYEDLRIDW
ncbi:MAG: M55 family metallopeptidase [Oscillospiraceae bacterium]|nr:M55 family metallopeptidase [Oscillospiraceae bacterium]